MYASREGSSRPVPGKGGGAGISGPGRDREGIPGEGAGKGVPFRPREEGERRGKGLAQVAREIESNRETLEKFHGKNQAVLEGTARAKEGKDRGKALFTPALHLVEAGLNASAYAAATGREVREGKFLEEFRDYMEMIFKIEGRLLDTYGRVLDTLSGKK